MKYRNPKFKILIVTLIFIEIISIFFAVNSYMNKELEKITINDIKTNSKMFKVMLATTKNNYEEIATTSFPELPYIINSSKSFCMDSLGNKVNSNVRYDLTRKKLYFNAFGSMKCTLFYDKLEMSVANQISSYETLWSSGLRKDGYRYVGENPNNYICFGTYDKNECLLNKNKYMYRMMGSNITNNYLDSGVRIIYSGLTRQLEDSDADGHYFMSDAADDINGPLFLQSTDFNFFQDDSWVNKYKESTYLAIKSSTSSTINKILALNTQNMYYFENNMSLDEDLYEATDYYGGMHGILTLSDYMLSSGQNSLNYTFSNYQQLKNSWLYIGNNNIYSTSNGEWTSFFSYNAGPIAYYIDTDGQLKSGNSRVSKNIRPILTLSNNVYIVSGSGTIDDPFMLSENELFELRFGHTIQGNHLIYSNEPENTRYYCFNKDVLNIENCNWTIYDGKVETFFPDYGEYYLHIINSENQILTLEDPLEYQKDINISLGSASKYYDGSPLLCPKSSYLVSELNPGDSIKSIRYIGNSITNRGSENCKCDNIIVEDANGNDVTDKYHFIISNGTITVN